MKKNPGYWQKYPETQTTPKKPRSSGKNPAVATLNSTVKLITKIIGWCWIKRFLSVTFHVCLYGVCYCYPIPTPTNIDEMYTIGQPRLNYSVCFRFLCFMRVEEWLWRRYVLCNQGWKKTRFKNVLCFGAFRFLYEDRTRKYVKSTWKIPYEVRRIFH